MPDCARLLPVVDKLSDVGILVVGDAMLDHYIIGAVDRISPEAPVPILRVTDEFSRVGGAANVAANITSLGATCGMVALAGCRGNLDHDGQILQDKCASRQVHAELIPALPCTVRKARMVAGRQQMLRVDWEHPYSSDDTGRFELPDMYRHPRRKKLGEMLQRVSVVVISDYAKGMVDEDLMEFLKSSGKPVIVDPRPQHSSLYRGVSLITPNRKEATEMLGEHRRLSGEELGKRLGEKLECDILVTLGEEGMCLCCLNGRVMQIPTRAREVFDVTGAGDTVVATFALALGAGCALEDCAKLANAAAGVVVGHVGCASITAEELRGALQASPITTR